MKQQHQITSRARIVDRCNLLKLLAFGITLNWLNAGFAQIETTCDTDPVNQSQFQGGNGDCSDYENYVPFIPEHTPIRTVRVMIHVFQKTLADAQNFSTGDEWVLEEIIDRLNISMADINQVNPNPYGSSHIMDARVRYDFDPTEVQYYVNEDAWSRDDSYYTTYNNLVVNNPNLTQNDIDSHMHLIITGATPNQSNPCAIGGATYVLGNFIFPWIGFASWWCATLDNGGNPLQNMNSIVGNLRHEIGHNLNGLNHIYDNNGDGCGDTEDCSNATIYCNGGESNNIMDDWQTCQCAMSECQLGRFIYNIENYPQKFNQLLNDYCDYDPLATITIENGGNYTWTAKRELNGDLVIEEGGQLTIQCQISLPSDGSVIIQEGVS